MAKSYAQLMKQIDVLRHQAESIKRKEVEGVIKRIKEAIAVYGLSAADLGLGDSTTRLKRKGAAPSKVGKLPRVPGKPKFRDDAGHSWSGKGPRPGWFKAALAGGKTIEDLTV
ncbi:MAG: H-NS histone family protein [Burkholderiaceae bacterium]|nr:H-NS histone family protein [Burkholderiaceae bacterium]